MSLNITCLKIHYSLHLKEAQSKLDCFYLMVPKEHSLSIKMSIVVPLSSTGQWARGCSHPIATQGVMEDATQTHSAIRPHSKVLPRPGPGDVYTATQLSHTRSRVSDLRGKLQVNPDPEAP